ncbi:MAG: MFS transporter [Elusimicrobia bacterium]|nr:MFS transporter [Elusimicrobiota bacterium]
MRALLAAWLALLPGVSAAQSVTRTVPTPVAPSVSVGVVLTPSTGAQPALAAPTLIPAPLPGRKLTLGTVPIVNFRAEARPLAFADRARATGLAVAKEAALAARAPAEGSRASTERQFALLTGEAGAPVRPPDDSVVEAPRASAWRSLLAPTVPRAVAAPAAEPSAPAPAPEAPAEAARSVRWMQAGTAFWKFGLDPVTIAVPLIALQAMGGAFQVAWLVILYGTSQMIATSLAAGLTDRFPAAKVAAGAALVQAGLVTGVLILSALGVLSTPILFPVYAALGAATGVIETARRVVPALVLGPDEQALKRYNGRLHIFYEIAGVAGAFIAGGLILKAGAAAALWLQPVAAVAAAFAFSRVRHAFAPAARGEGGPWHARLAQGVKAAVADVRAGARAILGDPALRWFTVVMVLPAVVHRVFESVLLPVFAKRVLELPAASAWMLGASNLGELLGAVALLYFAGRGKGPFAWLRIAAVGLLFLWALSTTTSLTLLLPIILLSSLTWAASDLSLLSFLQSRLPEQVQPRALGFLVGLTTLVSTATALALGRFLDLAGTGPGFIAANIAITALALAVAWAAVKLRK